MWVISLEQSHQNQLAKVYKLVICEHVVFSDSRWEEGRENEIKENPAYEGSLFSFLKENWTWFEHV